jgi:GTP cyclohydrolase II
MFSYLDPNVRASLIDAGKLIRLDAKGQIVAPSATPGSGTTLNVLGPIPLPVQLTDREVKFSWYAAVRHTELEQVNSLAESLQRRGEPASFAKLASHIAVNSVLIHGEPRQAHEPLVRVHSSCMTGDVFGSLRCECGPQLIAAMEQISTEPCGLLVYMSGHEGRGIGLWAKAVTYVLQDAGQDTYQANRSLGLPDDCRDFSDPAALLLHFLGGDRPFRLMTNNPKKVGDLDCHGLSQIRCVPHIWGVNDHNRRYMEAKRNWGHRLEDLDGKMPASSRRSSR